MYNIFFKKKKKELVGKNVFLKSPHINDWKEWAELRQRSRNFLQPWEPLWPRNYLTKNFFKRFVNDINLSIQNEDAFTFFIFNLKKNTLMGGLSLTNLKKGAYQSINLGYWMGEEFSGKGHMQDSIKVISHFCFDQLKLNRIEAACLPRNEASKKVLISSGFLIEGYAKKFLRINGKLEDHILFAKLKKGI